MKVALVTGASTGIGLATAHELLKRGHFVVLTARKESLNRLTSVDFLKKFPRHWVRPLDVREGPERVELAHMIEKEFGRLDILVNNAAVIYRAPVEFAYDFEVKEQMNVNFHSPLELIKCALPLMRRAGGGHIINVSSAAGFLAVPTMGLYAASKHALEAASEALYHELAEWKIHVSLVEPGFISSDSYLKARLSLALDRGHLPHTANYSLQNNMITCLIDRATRLTNASNEDVAIQIAKITELSSPPLRRLVTLDAKVFSFLKKFLPGTLYDRLLSLCLNSIRRQVEASLTQTPERYVGQSPQPTLK